MSKRTYFKAWFYGENLLAVIAIGRWLRDRLKAKPLKGKALTFWASIVYERVYGFGEIDHWREEDDPSYISNVPINRACPWEVDRES